MVKELKLMTLTDFAYLFSAQNEVEAVVKQVNGVVIPEQVSRVRQAWVTIKAVQEGAKILKRKGLETDDMDTLLPQPTLDRLCN